MNEITLTLDPFLARKVEIVALQRGTTFENAVLFLLFKVITPGSDAPVPAA